MTARGAGAECFPQGSGYRTESDQECTPRRPPQSCEVRAEWLRVCGSCYPRLGKGLEADLLAAVRGDVQPEMPFVSRKIPLSSDSDNPEAEKAPATGQAKEAESFKGLVHGATRVYGE